MPIRVRRHTIHTLAILSVLTGERKRPFTVAEVAERCNVNYGSAYQVLQRLFDSSLVARIEDHGEAVGHTRLSYQIEPRGSAVIQRILRVGFSNPAEVMKAWTAEDVEK
jgi:DNA-binding PadR family transcriptional regulator